MQPSLLITHLQPQLNAFLGQEGRLGRAGSGVGCWSRDRGREGGWEWEGREGGRGRGGERGKGKGKEEEEEEKVGVEWARALEVSSGC